MEPKKWLELTMEEGVFQALMATNQQTQSFGLTLGKEDVKQLMEHRKEVLEQTRRVEFGPGILPQLIYEFCDSDYICQSEYVETLKRLQEIFFYYKNETMEEVSDEELLHFMKEQFETVCRGDLDYLEGTCLDLLAQLVRSGDQTHITQDGRGVLKDHDITTRWDKELYFEALKDLY